MERLHLPTNIKVHYAAQEKANYAVAAHAMGIKYGLYSAFSFVYYRMFHEPVWPLIKMKYMKDTCLEMPFFINSNMRHTIQDSGLYSLLFGKHKDKATKEFVYKWYDELIRYTNDHAQDVTCVEVDAQAIIGVEETWHLRKKMRNELPNNRIINVFHVEDGIEGLDRLIEYSDYLAVGSGAIPWNVPSVLSIVKYIKKRKPDIDIHLLGCTNINIMHAVRHLCTSCDSTSWLSHNRFGEICGYHVNDLDINTIKSQWGVGIWNEMNHYMGDKLTASTIVGTQIYKDSYTKYCGNQN